MKKALLLLLITTSAYGERVVLDKVPESQIFMVMNAMAESIGVRCEYCHVRRDDKWIWASDENPKKAIGRDMMRMTLALNQSHFSGRLAVTCYSCHQGSTSVARMPPLPPHEYVAVAPAAAAVTLPSAEEIVKRYLAAVGDASRFKTLRFRGTVERPDKDRNGEVEITTSGSQNVHVEIKTAGGVVKQTIAGSEAWIVRAGKVTRLATADVPDAKKAIAIYQPVKVLDDPAQMKVAGIEKIAGRNAYVVTAPNRSYDFDKETALLLRVITTAETMIVPLPEQTDYSDYRRVGGVMMPFTIITSDAAPFDTSTRRFSEITHDVVVDEEMFRPPS